MVRRCVPQSFTTLVPKFGNKREQREQPGGFCLFPCSLLFRGNKEQPPPTLFPRTENKQPQNQRQDATLLSVLRRLRSLPRVRWSGQLPVVRQDVCSVGKSQRSANAGTMRNFGGAAMKFSSHAGRRHVTRTVAFCVGQSQGSLTSRSHALRSRAGCGFRGERLVSNRKI